MKRQVKLGVFLAWLKKQGVTEAKKKGRGSHRMLEREGYRSVTMPDRREIPRFIVKKTCKQLGLAPDDFWRDIE